MVSDWLGESMPQMSPSRRQSGSLNSKFLSSCICPSGALSLRPATEPPIPKWPTLAPGPNCKGGTFSFINDFDWAMRRVVLAGLSGCPKVDHGGLTSTGSGAVVQTFELRARRGAVDLTWGQTMPPPRSWVPSTEFSTLYTISMAAFWSSTFAVEPSTHQLFGKFWARHSPPTAISRGLLSNGSGIVVGSPSHVGSRRGHHDPPDLGVTSRQHRIIPRNVMLGYRCKTVNRVIFVWLLVILGAGRLVAR